MPLDMILTTLLIAAVIGWVMTWRELKCENTRLFVAAIRAAQERNEAMEFATRACAINHQLGAEMRARGLGVTLVGCGNLDCQRCADVWLEELEVGNA